MASRQKDELHFGAENSLLYRLSLYVTKVGDNPCLETTKMSSFLRDICLRKEAQNITSKSLYSSQLKPFHALKRV